MQSGFWKKIKKPIMVMAPMSGISDEPFRLMLLKYGKPDVFWTEFVSAEGLFSRGREYCLKILKFSKKERPIVAQIFGSNPADFQRAAKLALELGFDGVDINMGCPDNNIEKKGGGAALIKNSALAKEIIRATKNGAGKLPVSVKTRIGYSKNQVLEWIPALLEENIAALTVHFRSKKEAYIPPAHWELAQDVVKLRDQISPGTLVIGNGDVKSLVDANRLAKETGLDGIMVGRGLLGNPWFFSGKNPPVSKRLWVIVEHAEIFEKLHKNDTKKRFESMKKHFHAYTKGFPGAKDLREKLMEVEDARETRAIVEKFLKQIA